MYVTDENIISVLAGCGKVNHMFETNKKGITKKKGTLLHFCTNSQFMHTSVPTCSSSCSKMTQKSWQRFRDGQEV